MSCKRCVYLFVGAALLIFAAGLFTSGEVAAATLTWADNATNEAGTHIHRASKACSPIPPDTDFTKIGEVNANVITYVDSTTQVGNKYCYKVRAWNLKFANEPESAQYSAFSNLAGIEYPLAPVTVAPSQLNAAP